METQRERGGYFCYFKLLAADTFCSLGQREDFSALYSKISWTAVYTAYTRTPEPPLCDLGDQGPQSSFSLLSCGHQPTVVGELTSWSVGDILTSSPTWQTTNLMKILYPEYPEYIDTQNLREKKRQLKIRPQLCRDPSAKKEFRWQITTWKDAHILPSRKHKLESYSTLIGMENIF